MTGRVVCFGELLLRLAAPGREFLLQTPRLDVYYGGAEANVAVSLSRFGHPAAIVSVIPDNHLAHAALGELRRWGVDTSRVVEGSGRMGLYFLETGAIHRPSDILYDRADTAFARAPADAVNWTQALAGADRLHVSGASAAVSAAAAEAVVRAAEAARAAGVPVSVDCNYRQKLWEAWSGDAPAVLRRLLSAADVVFGDHRDFGLVLGRDIPSREAGAEAAFQAFPGLRWIASTSREQLSVDHHALSGFVFNREGAWTTPTYTVTPIVDRIGGGDAYAAGVLHGLLTGLDEQATARFAIAAACIKHSTPGDFNLASATDVEGFHGAGLDVKR
ncbi:MAG: sugar kinase [Proteobacteria bacterium]|nr:sugar kinase [Pseudomonadota bacterium]